MKGKIVKKIKYIYAFIIIIIITITKTTEITSTTITTTTINKKQQQQGIELFSACVNKKFLFASQNCYLCIDSAKHENQNHH